MKKSKCKPGEILREGYVRKDHLRKKYKRSDGKVINSSIVKGSYVEPTCVPDRGKEGKGPKTLPKLSGKLHLTKSYGYKLSKSDKSRHKSLKKAFEENNPLEVYRHLILIHNLTADSDNKNILKKDVEYMKKLYSKYKSNREIRGGNSNDEIMHRRYTYEKHVIDNNTIIIKTVEPDNTLINVEKIEKYYDKDNIEILEIIINDVSYGYIILKFDNDEVIIIDFDVKSGFRKSALIFIEKYAELNGCKTIIMENEDILDKITNILVE